jgi:hypothetical protein
MLKLWSKLHNKVGIQNYFFDLRLLFECGALVIKILLKML